MKFRKKQTIEAFRWFKNGDHPKDNVFRPYLDTGEIPTEPREGKVVRYFRNPHKNGTDTCPSCEHTYDNHGWIDLSDKGYTVHVGDWIVTNGTGYVSFRPDIFEQTYEKVENI